MVSDNLNNDDFIWDEPEEPKKPKKVQPSTPKPQRAKRNIPNVQPEQVSEEYQLVRRQKYANRGVFANLWHDLTMYFFFRMIFRTLTAIFIFILALVLVIIPNYRSRHPDFNLLDFIRHTLSPSEMLYSDYYNEAGRTQDR